VLVGISLLACISIGIIFKTISSFDSERVWIFDHSPDSHSASFLSSRHHQLLNRPLPVCAGADSFLANVNCSQLCRSRAKSSMVSAIRPEWTWSNAPSCHRCGSSWQGGDSVFKHLESISNLHWGDVLDAGTGKSSFDWLRKIGAKSIVAVTAAESIHFQLAAECSKNCEVVQGDWTDESLLGDSQFDVVLADYLLGAIDAYAPYFSPVLFQRLQRHLKPGGKLVIVGYEPLPERFEDRFNESVHFDQTEATLLRTVKVRDAGMLLSGARPYREFPLDSYILFLEQSGFEVEDVTIFPVVYGKPWLLSQLQVAGRLAKEVSNSKLSTGLLSEIELLRAKVEADPRFQLGTCIGADFTIIAQSK
jgi:SAM-dependent methyltransferase